jgi:hypothetical protein
MKNVDHKVDAHAKLLQTLLADLFQALREIKHTSSNSFVTSSASK